MLRSSGSTCTSCATLSTCAAPSPSPWASHPSKPCSPRPRRRTPRSGTRAMGRTARGARSTLLGTAGLLLSLLQPTQQIAAEQGSLPRSRGAGSRAGGRGPCTNPAQTSPCPGSPLVRGRGRAARPAAVSSPHAEDWPRSASGVLASVALPAPWPRPNPRKPRGGVSGERFQWARESSLCHAGGRGAWRGSGEALCVVLTCGQALLLRSVARLSSAVSPGSGCCCVRAWCALESKPLSRVFVTQLPAGDRYVPGPDSGGHVPWAPWPFNHVRCLHPGRELARWHWLRLQPSLLPGFLLTCSACGLGCGLVTWGMPSSGCRSDGQVWGALTVAAP